MAEFKDSNSQVIVIGTDEDHKEAQSDHFQVISRSELDKAELEVVNEFPVPILTQAARYFYSLLKNKRETYQCIQVEFNVDSKAFKTEEAIEIMFLAGYFNEVKSVNLSEYNPRIEDIMTGQLCAEMFYYFTLGVELRERNSEVKFKKPTPKVKNVFTDGS